MVTETKKTGQEVYLSDFNHSIISHPITIPEEGLLVRITVDGERLKASFEEGAHQYPGHSAQIITGALERLHVGRGSLQ